MRQVLFLIQLFLLSLNVCANAEAREMLRLRLRWGGGNCPAYGLIACDCGNMENLLPLSMDSESPGGAWLANGTIHIEQELPKKFNGFDVSVPYQPQGKLYVQISDQPNLSTVKRIEIPLRNLIYENQTFPLSESSNFQCSVNRVPGDELRVLLERDSLVFSPQDMFHCTVQPFLCSKHESGTANREHQNKGNETGILEFIVYRGRETFEVYRGKVSGVSLEGVIPAQVQFVVPENEGIYDIHLILRKNRPLKRAAEPISLSFTDVLTSARNGDGPIIAERKIQFAVLADAAQSSAAGNSEYQLKQEIDTAQNQWWEGLDRNQLRQFRASFPDPISLQCPQRIVRDMGEFSFLELPQSPNPRNNPVWEAFPFIIENPGTPHVLEVEYLANVEQTFSLSILEPNASGGISPPGIDSGVNVSPIYGDAKNQPIRLDRHHILFWPQTRNPILLLVNRHAQNSVCVGKLRLYSAGNSLPAVRKNAPDSQWNVPNAQTVSPKNSNSQFRKTALLIGKPMFAQAFSSPEMNDPQTGLCVSDWITFYEGGKRLVEYLHHVGFNTAVLSVYADGSTIYPSKILNPTPRFDNGTYFPTAQDPVRKDIAEMLFRMFDRQELTLIPSMDFDSPISILETAERFPGVPELLGRQIPNGSLRWIGPRGKVLIKEKDSLKDGAAYYDILNPFVQEIVLSSIAEVARRYGHHPSFGGISLQLHSDSFLILPSLRWGMDPDSVAQFTKDTGIELPLNRLEQIRFLTGGAGARAWLNWRASRMTLFYRRAAALLSNIPNAKLYLNGTDLFALEEHPELMPRLNGILSAQDVFLYFGLDMAQLKSIPNLIVSRPQKILTNKPLTEQAGDLQWKQTPGTYRLFQDQKEPAAVFYHAPDILRLEAFDKASPFKPAFTWMASTCAQTTAEARRPYAEALAMLDAFTIIEGGWNPVFGKEEALRGTLCVLSQLPAIHFNSAMNTAMNTKTPTSVIFRSCAHNGLNYAYAVNTTPFPISARVYVQPSIDQQTQKSNAVSRSVISLENGTPKLLEYDSRGLFWQVHLAPYQIEAIRFPGAPVMLLDPIASVPQEAKNVFEHEFQKLQICLNGLKNPAFYLGLKNPGFEQLSSDGISLADWNITYPQRLPNTEPLNPSTAQTAQTDKVLTGTTFTSDIQKNSSSTSGEETPGQATESTSSPESGIDSPNASANIDRQSPIFGDNALRLTSTGGTVRIMSAPFEANPTGRLTIYAWLRTDADEINLPLRLIVMGKTKGGKFFRTADLSSPEAGIGKEWRRLNIHVNDLPLAKEISVSIGFELCGKGNVWIDNIQLSDTHFSTSEIEQLTGIFSQFPARIASGNIAPCISTLECYWTRFLKEHISQNGPPAAEPFASAEPLPAVVSNSLDESPKTSPGVEVLPTKKGIKLPHLGQMPTLPQLPPPKFPGQGRNMDKEKETENKQNENSKNAEKNESYFQKMKNLLPW
ncbi:MAG: hypothetical protein E7028_03715 [Planctomycetaceae bacterium]|nr:hypothetical protein [Planctomycetaceae bacterium]